MSILYSKKSYLNWNFVPAFERLKAKRCSMWSPNFATVTNSPVECAFSDSKVCLPSAREAVKRGITELRNKQKLNSSKILHYAGSKVYLNYSPCSKNTIAKVGQQ